MAANAYGDPALDPAAETERIIAVLRDTVRRRWRRGGAVFGIDGGIDSAAVLHLCVRAFGPGWVTPLILAERDTPDAVERLARSDADALGVTPIREDIEPGLTAFGAYARRDAAVRRVFPAYDPMLHRTALVLPAAPADGPALNNVRLCLTEPDGTEHARPMPPEVYLDFMAADNMKQRARMLMLYAYAERLNHAVIGTVNKTESDQGALVKHGDTGVDIQPVAHLSRSQVYQLARHLGVQDEVLRRAVAVDRSRANHTSARAGSGLPPEVVETLWSAQERGTPVAQAAAALELPERVVVAAFDDIQRRRHATEYVRTAPVHLLPAR